MTTETEDKFKALQERARHADLARRAALSVGQAMELMEAIGAKDDDLTVARESLVKTLARLDRFGAKVVGS